MPRDGTSGIHQSVSPYLNHTCDPLTFWVTNYVQFYSYLVWLSLITRLHRGTKRWGMDLFEGEVKKGEGKTLEREGKEVVAHYDFTL